MLLRRAPSFAIVLVTVAACSGPAAVDDAGTTDARAVDAHDAAPDVHDAAPPDLRATFSFLGADHQAAGACARYDLAAVGGVALAAPETFTLAGPLFADAACMQAATTATIAAGQSQAALYLRADTSGMVELRAIDTAMQVALRNVTIDPAAGFPAQRVA